MITRKYVLSAQVAHNNGTGDKEYWNGAIGIKSFFKLKTEDIIIACREVVVEKLADQIDRPINESDIQILCLNRL